VGGNEMIVFKSGIFSLINNNNCHHLGDRSHHAPGVSTAAYKDDVDAKKE